MKVDRKRNVINLGLAETKKWQDAGPRGHEFRHNIRDIAAGMARATKRNVEIRLLKQGYDLAELAVPNEGGSMQVPPAEDGWQIKLSHPRR